MLVNKCRIYDKGSRVRYDHYNSVSDKRSGYLNHKNPYVVLDGKGKQKFQQKNNGGKS